MGQERLSSLALLHIHYDTDIDVMKIVDRFAALHPRHSRMKNTYDLQETGAWSYKTVCDIIMYM